MTPFAWTAWLLLQVVPASPDVAMPRAEREAWLMGTRFRIVLEDADRGRAHRVAETALLEVERIEALLSTWDAATPLSRVNRSPAGSCTPVELELEALLLEATDWARRTGHAFDPRIGALLDAWDLRGQGRIPDDAQLSEALGGSGEAGVALARHYLTRLSDAAWIDAGGFGKGAALRSAARRVQAAVPNPRLLMDLGGQLLALAPADAPWTVEVAHPQDRGQAVAVLAVHDRSVATSGSSERGRHVLDPRTGRLVEPWGSVTVIDVDAVAADVLSTALFVMGPDVGLAWAEEAGVGALFLRAAAPEVTATWTSAFEPWLLDAPAEHQPEFHKQVVTDR